MINHKFTAKPWKTPIDDPDYFDVEVLLYYQNKLLIILNDQKYNKKYSIQVNAKVHLRFITERFRFSIWSHAEWQKLVKNGFTCGVLKDSNFQQNIMNSKNMRNYFLFCEFEIFEILTEKEPLISSLEDRDVEKTWAHFINEKEINYDKESGLENGENIGKEINLKSNSEFESILKNMSLHFDLLFFSRESINFIVTDSALRQRYKITMPSASAFQCVQLPDHSKDAPFIINSSLVKLDSSQLKTEADDHGIFLDKDSFGSLYIKTNNIEIECVTRKPPKITLENRELKNLVKNDLTDLYAGQAAAKAYQQSRKK